MAKSDRLQGRKTLKVGNFLDEFEKDDVKKHVDIVDLFSSFGVELKMKGKSHIGHCPWHEDTNPSLSVDRDKGLYNCFGCGESGDIFTLTEKMKAIDFKGALSYLKGFNGISGNNGNSGKASVSKVGTLENDKDTPSSLPDLTLTAIAEYYHKRLYETPEAREYLKKRGFADTRLYTRFQIGYADGSLAGKISEKQKEELTGTGIFRENTAASKKVIEHFTGCITFPIVNDAGSVVGMYGRAIKDTAKTKHLYLKGKHRGVFHRKASKVYDEILLAESIIDALSLIALGIENIQSIYGTNGFTEEHLRILKEDRMKTVVLALDNDPAGVKAEESLKEKLLSEGFSVKVITPPLPPGLFSEKEDKAVKDWNEYLVAGGTKEAVLEALGAAEVMQAQERAGQGFSVNIDHLGHLFAIGEVTYRVTGVKEGFISSLRVNIKAEHTAGGQKYYDNLDLYSARSRGSYSANLSQEFGLEQKRVEKDLITILEYLEEERDRKLSGDTGKTTEIEISEEEKELGMKFLRNPDMYHEILDDMTLMGYVGENTNKLLVWLASVSRVLDKPLSVFIQSPPSTGKSFMLDTLLKLLPRESAEWVTSVSDQSFNYMDDEDFLDKIFMLGEALHNEIVEGQIRQMQSENMIARRVTIKDPKTGQMKSITVKHEVRLGFMMTSTAMKVNVENLSRCLVLRVDDSREQTALVQAMQRHKSSYDGYLEEKHVIPGIIQKHQAAQRLLKKVRVVNPFEKYINFPSTRSVMRRGHTQFLGLIHASCVARQMQKEPVEKTDPYSGEKEYVYECDLIDYETARRLFIEGTLLQQDGDLSDSVAVLYEDIRTMVREKARKEKLTPVEVTFIQKEVREISALSPSAIKQYLRILVDYEYIQLIGGRRHGTRFCYRVREDTTLKEIDISTIIPTVQEIKEMIQAAKQEKV